MMEWTISSYPKSKSMALGPTTTCVSVILGSMTGEGE